MKIFEPFLVISATLALGTGKVKVSKKKDAPNFSLFFFAAQLHTDKNVVVLIQEVIYYVINLIKLFDHLEQNIL